MPSAVLRALCIVGAAALAAALVPPAAPTAAAGLTVTTTADGSGGPACTLRDAIIAANTDSASGGCPAGRGTDTIGFGVTGTIRLGGTLPGISSTLAITGPAGGIVISGASADGSRARALLVLPGGTLTLERLTIADGRVDGTGQDGGAIYVANVAALTVIGSTFLGNTAAGSSGGAIFNGGTATVIESTFADNRAADRGGAIFNVGRLAVVGSTFVGNSAGSGGAIRNATVGHSTIRGTILADSLTGGNCGGRVTDDGYNLEDGTTCGFSIAKHSRPSTRPLLDPAGLKDNGGPTQTVALRPDSPAIDAIPRGDHDCGATAITDQRGATRPRGAGCDIGAYEAAAEAVRAPIGPAERGGNKREL